LLDDRLQDYGLVVLGKQETASSPPRRMRQQTGC
jgi:hypothetical protein